MAFKLTNSGAVLLLSVLTLLFPMQVEAETIFLASPELRATVGPGGNPEVMALTEDQQQANSVEIARCGDVYCWRSRGNVEMVRNHSGIYDIFLATSGAGYVKIERPLVAGKPFRFLEHVHSGLATITFFGSTFDYR